MLESKQREFLVNGQKTSAEPVKPGGCRKKGAGTGSWRWPATAALRKIRPYAAKSGQKRPDPATKYRAGTTASWRSTEPFPARASGIGRPTLLAPMERKRAMKIRRHCGTLLLLALLGAATAADGQVQPQLAQQWFEEATKICERDAGRLWGVSLCGPMVIVDQPTNPITATGSTPAPAPPLESLPAAWTRFRSGPRYGTSGPNSADRA